MPENPVDGIEVEFSGYKVTLTPQSERGQAVAEMVGNSNVYDEFFDENSYLKYTPILAGIKEDIVLESYAENVSYEFLLETDGLCLYNDDEGYYLADVTKEEVIFDLGEVIVYDAIGKPYMGTMDVSTIEEGEKYMLTLSVADEFLADPTTEYPVTIDPTITISDNETGTGSILDAPIFKGYPSKNFGNYIYNSVGTTSSAYGVGRTVVKLPGLYNSEEYLSISDADQIQSVIFGAKDATGGSSQRIYLYPLTENTTWTESNVTWNNVGAYSTALSYSASLKYGQVTEYDITEFAKAWINGEYSATAGFIMINKDESRNRSFCSSEHSTTDYRPYVEMTYTPEISLSASSKSIVEGGTTTLTATTNADGLTVSWSSSNTTVATVSATGKVTAKKAGTAIITAKITDEDGTSYTSTCTVYVYVPNGVYYIQNMNSGYYLSVCLGNINNLSKVFQYSKYSESALDQYRLSQMWKVYYLGNGRYSVRPMHKLNMGLDVTSGNVDIYNIGTTDSLSAIQSYGEWVIEWGSTGYVFKNNGNSSLTMQVQNASAVLSTPIIASTYSSATNCRWTLSKIASPPSGVLIYDTASQTVISDGYTKAMAVGESRTLNSLGITTAIYSPYIIDQVICWKSSKPSVATINNRTGEVTGVSEGTTIITAYKYVNGSYLSEVYTLEVLPFEDGTYFIKNREYQGCMQIDNNDISNKYVTSGAIMENWTFNGDDCQRWELKSLDNGYYKIMSVQSGLALSVKSAEVLSRGVSLVQESYGGAYRQQWKIIKTEAGSYKIAPRSADGLSREFVMVVETSESVEGANVQQEIYVENEIYIDEWYFIATERAFTIGGEIGGEIVASNTSKNWAKCGYQAYYDVDPSVESLSEYNLNASVVTFLAHGSQHGIALLNDVEWADELEISSGNPLVVSDYDLSKAKLYVYCSCLTASDTDGTGRNLCTETLESGVECVIGWTQEIGTIDMFNWNIRFQTKLIEGKMVKDAVDYANSFDYIDNASIKAQRIYGNDKLVLNLNTVFENSVLENTSIEEIAYNISTVPQGFEYTEDNIETLLKNNYDVNIEMEHSIIKIDTSEDGGDYVVDWRYLHNGFMTECGYSIVINDGNISTIQEHNLLQMAELQGESIDNEVPEITQAVIDAAMLLARDKIEQKHPNSTIIEQQGEKYYNIIEKAYYYRVRTVYQILTGEFGAEYLDYSL